MKILVLYTSRSGTNNICDYFLKQNPNYKYFNQPFTDYKEDGITGVSYNECIIDDNVLIKNAASSFKELNISKEQLLLDFDKVLLISRKDKRSQALSHIIAANNQNFLDKRKRNYYVDIVDDEILTEVEESANKYHNVLMEFMDSSFRFFYYEDLYYGDFSELFEYLGIKFIKDDFDSMLDVKNKYRSNDLFSKTTKTLI